jgi:Mg-chelatase subunit ChlD
MQNSSSSDSAMNCPFVIVLSDGRFNKNNVRPYLLEAKEKKYLYIFVILDSLNQQIKIEATGITQQTATKS